jgi:hypothetical protein
MGIEQDSVTAILKDIRNITAVTLNGKTCIGYQNLVITAGAVVRLNVPANAIGAKISVDSAAATITAGMPAIRFTLDGTTPVTGTSATNNGIPAIAYEKIEILGQTNLDNFRAICCETNTFALKIHYFN